MASHNPNTDTTTPNNTSSGGGGFLARLRGQAEAALHRIPAMDELQHSVRQQYVSSNPRQSSHTLRVQLAIKGEKGVIIDQEALARETKSFSKNLLDFVRLESPNPASIDTADIQDVGDRIAFLTYKIGELHSDYAKRLEQARTSLKDIRNFENTLQPQRDRRLQLERDIGKLRTHTKPDTATHNKLAQAQGELDQYLARDSPLMAAETEVMTLRRRKLVESFSLQFEALQELGEKLAIIGSYGRALVKDWDIDSPHIGQPESYTSGARTASVRSGVEHDLNHWSLAKANTPQPNVAQGSSTTASSGASIAPSFHDSHKDELASIRTDIDPLQAHNQALDSYYQQPTTPPLPPPRHPSTHSGVSYVSEGSAASTAPIGAPGAFPSTASPSSADPISIPGVGTGVPNTSSASPLVQQLNTAPVTNLPHASGVAQESQRDPFHDRHASPPLGATLASRSPIPASGPTPPPPAGTAGMATTHLPTVAETGAPITGTGGPSSGVLAPPAQQQKTKEQEAKEELDQRFHQYSGHSDNVQPASTASGAGTGATGAEGGLERELSMRGRQGDEQLPAYENTTGVAPPPEKSA